MSKPGYNLVTYQYQTIGTILSAIDFNKDTSYYSVNVKPLDTIDELSMSTGHSLKFYQRQTNGWDLISYLCQQGH